MVTVPVVAALDVTTPLASTLATASLEDVQTTFLFVAETGETVASNSNFFVPPTLIVVDALFDADLTAIATPEA
jgi:hypothetical protein